MDARAVEELIDTYLAEKGYDKHDIMHEEQHLPEGKQISIHKEPYKNVSHYAKFVLATDISASGLKQVVVDGKEVDEGSLSVTITPFLQFDWQGKWTSKPSFYFLARFIDKFVYYWYNNLLKKGLREDAEFLAVQVRKFLNMR